MFFRSNLRSTYIQDDCTVLMGDFNCELQRNVQGYTDRWLMNKSPDDGHSDKVMDLLRAHDLFAVDSLFRPKRKAIGQGKKSRICNATYLQKDASRRPKKLDYFFISNRWKSCVVNSTTNWAPAAHRFGKFFDHCLLQIKWKWRIKSIKTTPAKDFKAMDRDDWTKFEFEINEAMHKYDQDNNETKDIDETLTRMNTCITHAIKQSVPDKNA